MKTLKHDPVVPPFWDVFKKLKNSDIAKTSKFEIYHPTSTLNNNQAPINFKVNKTSIEQYIDWDESYIELTLEITGLKKDGKADTPADHANNAKVSPINNIAHSLFKKISVEANHVEISSIDNYAYVAYLNTLINFDNNSQKTYCNVQGWVNEPYISNNDNILNAHDTTVANSAPLLRKQMWTDLNGNFILKPFSPLFHLDSPMIPDVDFIITLERYGNGKFYMMGEPEDANNPYEIAIRDAKLFIHLIEVSPDYAISINTARKFDHEPINYNFSDMQLYTQDISEGAYSFTNNDLFQGRHPCRVMFMFVNSAALKGNLTKNPFKLEHLNTTSVKFTKNGNDFPFPELKCNFEKRKYARVYHHTMKSLNAPHPAAPFISYKQFGNGFTFFSYDMSPDQAGGSDQINPLLSPLNFNLANQQTINTPL